MDFAPFLNLPVIIQLHALSGLIALVIGPFAVLRPRRDRLHKTLGYIWVLAMASLGLTGLMIPSFGLVIIGHFGPIHLFVVITAVSLFMGMRAIFRGDISAHRAWLSGLYWQGLLLAGAFNFLPGRMVNRMLFPNAPELGYLCLAAGLSAILWFRLIRPCLTARAALPAE